LRLRLHGGGSLSVDIIHLSSIYFLPVTAVGDRERWKYERIYTRGRESAACMQHFHGRIASSASVLSRDDAWEPRQSNSSCFHHKSPMRSATRAIQTTP
jgi:hypothetical protein